MPISWYWPLPPGCVLIVSSHCDKKQTLINWQVACKRPNQNPSIKLLSLPHPLIYKHKLIQRCLISWKSTHQPIHYLCTISPHLSIFEATQTNKPTDRGDISLVDFAFPLELRYFQSKRIHHHIIFPFRIDQQLFCYLTQTTNIHASHYR